MVLEKSKLAALCLCMFVLGFLTGCSISAPAPYLDAEGNPILDETGAPVIPRTVLDRVEFDDDEYGCVDLRGQIDLNPSMIVSTKANLVLKKVKLAPTGQITPEC